MIVNAIVAVGNQGQIGLNGVLPWHCPEDLKWFKSLTEGQVLICGYNTAQTLPMLPNRTVICDDIAEPPEVVLSRMPRLSSVWIIGGAKTYQRYAHLIDRWHIGKIDYSGDADAYFDFSMLSSRKW